MAKKKQEAPEPRHLTLEEAEEMARDLEIRHWNWDTAWERNLRLPMECWEASRTNNGSHEPGCQPAVLERMRDIPVEEAKADGWEPSRWEPEQGMTRVHEYRSACWGCDWTGPIVRREQEAVEDALDHTHPGWRDTPTLEGMPSNIRLAGEYSQELWRRKHIQKIGHLFPPDWEERKGPNKAWREPMAGRHVPGYGLFGGYEVGVIRITDPKTEVEKPEQSALF